MSYNMTFVDSSTNFYDLLTGLVSIEGGVVLILLLGILYVALISLFKNYETSQAITISSFIMTIIASLFWFAGFIGWYITVIPLILTIGGLIISYFKD